MTTWGHQESSADTEEKGRENEPQTLEPFKKQEEEETLK